MPAPNRFILALGLGAALMYYCDPQGGRRRRALLGERWLQARHKLEELRRSGDDALVEKHVREALAAATCHSAAIEVRVNQGWVHLEGAALAEEVDRLVDCLRAIEGVRAIDNRLALHDDPAALATSQRAWLEATRALAASAGLVLAVTALVRGGLRGVLMSAVAGGLIARASTRTPAITPPRG